MGCTQKVRMFKRIPRNPFYQIFKKNVQILQTYFLKSSKSVCGFRAKNNLSICNMMAYTTRKVIYEKVRISATVEDCNLRIPQGTMC